MKQFAATIPIGIGDLIYIKGMFEPIKHEFSSINFRFHKELITAYHKDVAHFQFLEEFGKLLFGEAPYIVDDSPSSFLRLEQMMNLGITPHKPELASLLCVGTPLEIGPYIVINTKVREMPQSHLREQIRDFWTLLNKLSEKYKIVILGEKVIEMNPEYEVYTSDNIYSLYPHIYNNVDKDKLVDLTVPALGITAPNLKHIQQDCLIMNQAQLVINFGIGGGFCLATAVANTIGYRYDNDPVADVVFSKTYPNAVITKNWSNFLQTLGQYL